ncbi:unnamed protein product, partial [Symbiodinium sp. CCMP2456]
AWVDGDRGVLLQQLVDTTADGACKNAEREVLRLALQKPTWLIAKHAQRRVQRCMLLARRMLIAAGGRAKSRRQPESPLEAGAPFITFTAQHAVRSAYVACLWPVGGEPEVSVADFVLCKVDEQRSCLPSSHLQCPCIEGGEPGERPDTICLVHYESVGFATSPIGTKSCEFHPSSMVPHRFSTSFLSRSASPCSEVYWATCGTKCLRRMYLEVESQVFQWRMLYFAKTMSTGAAYLGASVPEELPEIEDRLHFRSRIDAYKGLPLSEQRKDGSCTIEIRDAERWQPDRPCRSVLDSTPSLLVKFWCSIGKFTAPRVTPRKA